MEKTQINLGKINKTILVSENPYKEKYDYLETEYLKYFEKIWEERKTSIVKLCDRETKEYKKFKTKYLRFEVEFNKIMNMENKNECDDDNTNLSLPNNKWLAMNLGRGVIIQTLLNKIFNKRNQLRLDKEKEKIEKARQDIEEARQDIEENKKKTDSANINAISLFGIFISLFIFISGNVQVFKFLDEKTFTFERYSLILLVANTSFILIMMVMFDLIKYSIREKDWTWFKLKKYLVPIALFGISYYIFNHSTKNYLDSQVGKPTISKIEEKINEKKK